MGNGLKRARAAARATQASPLAPLGEKTMRQSLRTGRLECWGALTADGEWWLERLEQPGTPWAVVHQPTGITVDYRSNLDDCRWYVAAGHATAALGRIQAHDRGGHDARRDPACAKC